ncbi:18295_t:CDS:1 [Dentiscutata erythropus]|uniref:18295_t:CDS:1 n=1 Tax=Dentiscutata erythropus TaxID=1348616 RepID=A0A9N9BJH4_9GLOM|nr:18295_t:CDS:1 [Dentiscutata erythropus]
MSFDNGVNFKYPLQRRDYDFQDLEFSIIVTPNKIDPDIEINDPTKNPGSFRATISFMKGDPREDCKIPEGIECIDVTDMDKTLDIEPILNSFFNIKLSRDYDIIHNELKILSLRRALGRWQVNNYQKTESRKLFEKKRKFLKSNEFVNRNQLKLTTFFPLHIKREDDDDDVMMV